MTLEDVGTLTVDLSQLTMTTDTTYQARVDARRASMVIGAPRR